MTVFAKGAWYALEDLCDTKYDVIGLDWLHDPAQAYSVAQAKEKVLQGNMDPGVLYGGKDAISAVVKEMVEGFDGGKHGWIANLGHGVTPFVDPDDLRHFFQEIHNRTANNGV